MSDKKSPELENYSANIDGAELVLSCTELKETLNFYIDLLGFRIDSIFPADDPQTAMISGYGTKICLQIDGKVCLSKLRFTCTKNLNKTIRAPNGTEIELVSNEQPLIIPNQISSFVHTKYNESDSWHLGRAGMRYRDLIPGRQGGRFIASHIQIPEAGPVSDYVHFHKVRFQMIYCYKGWVRLVYEDQGEEFILKAGDAVLQPPEIRHRVLESSSNLDVIEIGCPAIHETHADHEMLLPNGTVNPEHDFNGQTFVHHENHKAVYREWRREGFEARDLGIADATQGLAGAYVVRRKGVINSEFIEHKEEFLMFFVLTGNLSINTLTKGSVILETGDTCIIPKHFAHCFEGCSDDFEMLEVRFSANFKTQPITESIIQSIIQ